MRYFTLFILIMTIIPQIRNSISLLDPNKPILTLVCFYWAFHLIVLIILGVTVFYPKKIWVFNFLFFIGFLRSLFIFFDLDERRLRNT